MLYLAYREGFRYTAVLGLVFTLGCSDEEQRYDSLDGASDLSINHQFTITDSDETMLSHIATVHVASDGHILIPDYQQGHIHEFDQQGNLLNTFIESGSGPGEVEDFGGVILTPDDELGIFDFGNRRISYYERTGSDWEFQYSTVVEDNLRWFYPAGDSWLTNRMSAMMDPEKDSIQVDRLSMEGDLVEEGALEFKADQGIFIENENGMAFLSMSPTFLAVSHIEFADDYFVYAYTDDLSFTFYDLESLEPTDSFSWDLPPVPLSDETRQEFIREETDRNFPSGVDAESQISDQLPDEKTVMKYFTYDREREKIWAQVYNEDGAPWLVFDRSGSLLYKTYLDYDDYDLRLIHDGRIYVGDEDESGLPMLKVYEYEY